MNAGRTSRLVTMAASVAAILLWAAFYVLNRAELGTGTKIVMLVMMILAGIALFAVDKGRAGFALLASLLAFIPVGLYTLGGNNYSVLIGVANVVMVGGSITNLLAKHQDRIARWRKQIDRR